MENWVRPPDLGYGVPGAVALDAHREIETARQQNGPKLSVSTTRHLCAPVLPKELISEFTTLKADSQQAFMTSEALGGVDFSMLRTMANESLTLESPSLYDPILGQKVLVDEHHQVFYGDDQYIRKVENDEIVANFDLKSPVLQIDSFLCRTRKGIAYFDTSHLPTRKLSQPMHLIDGNFMHLAPVCSTGNVVDQMLTTDRLGMLKIWDIENLKCSQEITLPRGNLTGWSRAWQLNDLNSILWCNVYEMSQIDLRSNDRKTDRSIIRFEDKQQEIKASCHDSNGNTFVLTSYHLYWLSTDFAGGSGQPEIVLTLEQPLAALDYSISLTHTYFETKNGPPMQLVTASSQLSSDILCWTLGTTSDGRPCSLQDQYTINLWPNMIPQSHAAIQNGPNSISAYYFSENNGLFSQILELGSTNGDNDDDDDTNDIADVVGDLPFVDVPTDSLVHDLPKHCVDPAPPDFNYPEQEFSCDFYNFSMYYRHAFQEPIDHKLEPPRQNPSVTPSQDLAANKGKFEMLGFEDREAFTQYCMDMWSKPLIVRGDSARTVAYRQKQIQRIVSDMAECSANFGVGPTEKLVKNPKSLNRTVQQVIGKWHTDDEQEEEKGEDEEDLQSQSQSQSYSQSQAMSQTQYESQSQTQSQFPTLSQSQPVLGLPKKKSKKSKKVKKRKLM